MKDKKMKDKKMKERKKKQNDTDGHKEQKIKCPEEEEWLWRLCKTRSHLSSEKGRGCCFNEGGFL